MLSLSQTTGYAVLALSCLEGPDGTPMSVSDVAKCRRISKTYLSKIVHKLAAKGLVITKRGAKGGLILSSPPKEISLWQIAVAIEGPRYMGECLLGIEPCSDWCPTHSFWKKARKQIEKELRRRTLLEIKQVQACDPACEAIHPCGP